MRIATWNINSVRLRAPIVVQYLKEHGPDVLALQETKTPDDKFPFEVFIDAGYPHIHIHGMKGYNGVALISRKPLSDVAIHHHCGLEDCRHIAASVEGVRVHTLYIPAGGDEPDPVANPKYKHKLDFVDSARALLNDQHSVNDNIIVLGDFNIAPYEHDVWSSKQLQNVVSHTRAEKDKLSQFYQSLNWVDTARHFVPMSEKSYSWWSYRNRDWKKSNRGRRLDHIWVSQPLGKDLKVYETLPEARDWEKPSDHVPVLIELGK